MQYSLFSQPKAITVSELARYIRQMFEVGYRLQDVLVQGEIGSLSPRRASRLISNAVG